MEIKKETGLNFKSRWNNHVYDLMNPKSKLFEVMMIYDLILYYK